MWCLMENDRKRLLIFAKLCNFAPRYVVSFGFSFSRFAGLL